VNYQFETSLGAVQAGSIGISPSNDVAFNINSDTGVAFSDPLNNS
jgi:hypothetical protein